MLEFNLKTNNHFKVSFHFIICFFLLSFVFADESLQEIFDVVKQRDYYDRQMGSQYKNAIQKLNENGRRDLAIEEFKKAILFDPQLAGMQGGELLEEAYQQVLSDPQSSDMNLYMTGYLGYLSGDYQVAQQKLEKLAHISQDADILEECNQLIETIVEEQVLWGNPEDTDKKKVEYLFGLSYSYCFEMSILPPPVLQWIAQSPFSRILTTKIKAFSGKIPSPGFPVNLLVLKKEKGGNYIWGVFDESGKFSGILKGGIILARKSANPGKPDFEVMENLPNKNAEVFLYRFENSKEYKIWKNKKISGKKYQKYLQSRSALLKKLNPRR